MSDDAEKIKKELREAGVAFKDDLKQPKDYDREISELRDAVAKRLAEKSESPKPQAEHLHATHSSDRFCSDCGSENPDYSEDQVKCVDCGRPIGTVKEAEKVKKCRHCGSESGGEHSSKGYTL
jgi:NADH pyrophosphatase NudC (nudix superfamily)